MEATYCETLLLRDNRIMFLKNILETVFYFLLSIVRRYQMMIRFLGTYILFLCCLVSNEPSEFISEKDFRPFIHHTIGRMNPPITNGSLTGEGERRRGATMSDGEG